MKTTTLTSIVCSAVAVMALPATDLQPKSLQRRQCQGPGAGMCSVITSASLSSLGIKGSTVGAMGVAVVGGSCDSIIASGDLQRNSPGFSADFTTTYGPHLYYGADYIGVGDIEGVRFQYNGASYTQDDCFNYDFGDFPQAGSAVQCNFAC